jgi:hypothetical protein
MDKLNNYEDAKKLLQGLGLHIDEAVVRQVINALSEKSHQSLYSLYATRAGKPVPVCGKGTVYKIKKLYDDGDLQPYLDYVSDALTIGEAKDEQIREAKHNIPIESRIIHMPYQETPHKKKMRELAKQLVKSINLPSLWDKRLWQDLSVDFQPGMYYLSIGAVEIGEHEQIKVNYYNVSTNFAEPYLIKGLFSHLSTSGLPKFKELVVDKGKLDNLIGEAGKYSLAILNFLKLITGEVKGYRTKINFHDEMKSGLTRWFILTIWKDAIDKAGGYSWIHNSWYKPHESIPGTSLFKLDCGGNTMGIAKSEKTLKKYKKWHKKLRVKYAEHQSAKDIYTKNQEISDLAQEIRERLQGFSDMEPLPGHCDLC